MKIAKIKTLRVAVPYIPAIRKYRPTEHTDRPILLVRMYTDEGIVGIGEGGRGQDVEDLIPQWIGRDPFEVNLREANAPFQAALYDIVGKALGLPAWRLMGDIVRDKVPVNYWSCHMAPEDTAKEAAIAVEQGFRTHKLKARPWDIVRQVELITEAAGSDYAIIVDPNGTFETLAATVRIARELQERDYNIQCFEDPIPKGHNGQLALMRQKLDIPIAPHLGHPLDVLEALKAEAADMFNLSGNFDTVYRSAALADAEGLPVWVQIAGLSLGVAAAFATHACAVIRNATLPADTLHFLKENDLLLEHPLECKDGHIEVPQGPGLGVELDERVVERYRV